MRPPTRRAKRDAATSALMFPNTIPLADGLSNSPTCWVKQPRASSWRATYAYRSAAFLHGTSVRPVFPKLIPTHNRKVAKVSKNVDIFFEALNWENLGKR